MIAEKKIPKYLLGIFDKSIICFLNTLVRVNVSVSERNPRDIDRQIVKPRQR